MQVRLRRKLAVILHADVVGSTHLVQVDEARAHESMQRAFRRLAEFVRAYGGIAHELRGDALVAEFDRASDAVCAALAFQGASVAAHEESEDELLPRLRIGASLGEVVAADHTVTGDGVVLAQRIEQLAEPGGVCIQGALQEALPQRMPFSCSFLGERSLKGFDTPVRVFSVSLRAGQRIGMELVAVVGNVELALAA